MKLILCLCALLLAILLQGTLSLSKENSLSSSNDKLKPTLEYFAHINGDKRIKRDNTDKIVENSLDSEIGVQNETNIFDVVEEQISLLSKILENTMQETSSIKATFEDLREINRNISIQNSELKKEVESLNIQISNLQSKLDEYSEVIANSLDSCPAAINYSGLLRVKLNNISPFVASCDSKLAGSGWTVIQRRFDGSVNFRRDWSDYEGGFGNVDGEFFIGLKILNQMTKGQRHELYIHLVDKEDQVRFARYDNFVVENDLKDYELSSVGEFTGNAGDSFRAHKGSKFSTPLRDNDVWRYNCADKASAGWWYFHCSDSDLNAYNWGCNKKDEYDGDGCIHWNSWHGRGYSLKAVQMMIRPWEAK